MRPRLCKASNRVQTCDFSKTSNFPFPKETLLRRPPSTGKAIIPRLACAHPKQDVEKGLQIVPVSVVSATQHLHCHKLHRAWLVPCSAWAAVFHLRQVEVNEHSPETICCLRLRDWYCLMRWHGAECCPSCKVTDVPWSHLALPLVIP
jgi:hypothetical protein